MLFCRRVIYRESMPSLNFCRQQHLSFFVWFCAELGGQLRSCSGDGSQGNHFGRVQGIHQVQRNRETTTHVQTHGQVKIFKLQTIEPTSKTTVPKVFCQNPFPDTPIKPQPFNLPEKLFCRARLIMRLLGAHNYYNENTASSTDLFP